MDKTISEKDYKNALKVIELFRIEQNGIPHALQEPEFKPFVETMEEYITLLQKGVIGDDDFKEEIFIAAIEAVFGTDIWLWVQKHTKTRR